MLPLSEMTGSPTGNPIPGARQNIVQNGIAGMEHAQVDREREKGWFCYFSAFLL